MVAGAVRRGAFANYPEAIVAVERGGDGPKLVFAAPGRVTLRVSPRASLACGATWSGSRTSTATGSPS